jgi:PPP family 3-phenylpropionic acid transporter
VRGCLDRTTGSGRRTLWSIRLYYFALYGGSAFLFPFLGLYFRRRGLSGTQIGFLGAAGATAALLAAPLWGWWSDRATHPQRVLQTALLTTALGVLCLSQQRVFGWIAAVRSVQALAGAGVEPLSDALVFSLARGDSRVGFGSVRLWGSLGWAAIVLLSGWIIERTGMFSAFVGYAVALVVGALILNRLDGGAVSQQRPAAVSLVGVWRGLGNLLKDPVLIGLAVALVFIWLASVGLYQFEPIFLDELGASETLIGLSGTLQALAELPGMLWADRLVRRYGSYHLLSAGVLLSAGMRGLVLLSPTLATVIIARVLAGVSFSFFTVALVAFISEHAPAGQVTTVWALYSVTLRGLVSMLGGPLGGIAFDALGAYWLYAVALAGGVLGWLALRLCCVEQRVVS